MGERRWKGREEVEKGRVEVGKVEVKQEDREDGRKNKLN